MKRLTQHMLPILLFTMTVLFIACSKEGPAGPKGDTGATGATGATGPTGPKGDTGVANVIYSDWFDVTYLLDTVRNGTTLDTLGYYADIAAPKLTNTILNTGTVKVYVNLNTPAQPVIVPLPYFDISTLVNINPYYFLQTIELYANTDASTITSSGVKSRQYRYVLIPGGVHARTAVDWNNYESVKKYLGLKD